MGNSVIVCPSVSKIAHESDGELFENFSIIGFTIMKKVLESTQVKLAATAGSHWPPKIKK